MKKLIFFCVVLLSVIDIKGQNYNALFLSYDNTQLWGKTVPYSDNYFSSIGKDGNTLLFNGFGLQYVHGFSMGHLEKDPMNFELGFKASLGFYKNSKDSNHDAEIIIPGTADEIMANVNYKNTILMRLDIPFSFVYHFHINDSFFIAPYLGLNFRFNVIARSNLIYDLTFDGKTKTERDHINWLIKENIWEDEEGWHTNHGVESEQKWNIFQIGWHFGIRFEIKKLIVGVEYGTDFIPMYRHNWKDNKNSRITTGNLSANIGIKF